MSSGLFSVLDSFVGLFDAEDDNDTDFAIYDAATNQTTTNNSMQLHPATSILKAASFILDHLNHTLSSMITIAHNENPPYINSCANYSQLLKTASCPYPGITAETITTILKSAKLSYKLEETSNIGESVQLVRDSPGTCTMAYDNQQRRRSFQFTSTITYDLPVAVYIHETRAPLLNFMVVFDVKTWILFGLVLSMFGLCSLLIYVIVKRDSHLRHRSLLAHKLLFFTSLLIGLILSLYENSLLSKLLVSSSSPLFTNIEELADLISNGRLILTLIDDDTWREQLQFDDRLSILTRALADNPVHWVADREAYEHALKSGANHVGLESLYSGYLFAIENQHAELCQLPYWLRTPIVLLCNRHLAAATMQTLNRTIEHNFAYFEAITARYGRLLALQKWQRDRDERNLRLERIKLADVYGMFVVWALGLLLSVGYCMLEYCGTRLWVMCCTDSIANAARPSIRTISIT